MKYENLTLKAKQKFDIKTFGVQEHEISPSKCKILRSKT